MSKIILAKSENKEIIKKYKFELPINTDELLVYYNNDEVQKIADTIGALKIMDFSEILEEIRNLKAIESVGEMKDATVSVIMCRYRDIRVAINTIVALRDKFADYKLRWNEVQRIVNEMYNYNLIVLLKRPEIIELKSKELREANIKYESKHLIKLVTTVDIIMGRIEQVEKEFTSAIKQIDDAKSEISRIQSAMTIALDTGEIGKTYWRHKDDD